MHGVKIPHGAFILVGDGRKALFLRNEGDEKFPNLKTERVFRLENPPTHEQGTDRPGRAFASTNNRRSAVEQTDWHDFEEHKFAREVASALEHLVRDRGVKSLVIAAPPRTLAELRHCFHDDIKKRIIAEIDKDFTHQPVYEIEKQLTGA